MSTTSNSAAQQSLPSKAAAPLGSMAAHKFVAGYFGGICQAIFSHPFDLIKSRVQNGTYDGIASCVRGTLAAEGATAFYKGVGPPIAIAGIFNATLFTTNELAKRVLVAACGLDAAEIPLPYVMLSGVMAAPIAVAVLTPADVVKIQLQLQRESKATAQYSGMVDCVVKLWRNEGYRSLTRGYVPTLMTRVVGLPGFFGGNEAGKKWYKRTFPGCTDFAAACFGGSCAGISFWTLCYPFDLIKTKTQAQMRAAAKVSPADIAREIFAKGGVRGFYYGFGACMLRAVPANASVFAGVDYGEKVMKKYGL